MVMSIQVLDDFGRLGRSWRETDEERTDRETGIVDLCSMANIPNPVRVVAFNTAERWSRDVSAHIAAEIAGRSTRDGFDVPPFLEAFVDTALGSPRVGASRGPSMCSLRNRLGADGVLGFGKFKPNGAN
jgi:hypothetical protein